MKLLELNNILKTNALLSRLQAFDTHRSLEIEAYSCKQTWEQKKHKDIPKPLRLYISALELAFPDYDFKGTTEMEFCSVTVEQIRNELSFVFFTLYKNHEDVKEFIKYLDAILEQCVDLGNSRFLIYEGNIEDLELYRIFLIHDKKRKRMLIIKSTLEKESM